MFYVQTDPFFSCVRYMCGTNFPLVECKEHSYACAYVYGKQGMRQRN